MNIFRRNDALVARRMAELEAENRNIRLKLYAVHELVTAANGHPHGDKYMVPAWKIREALKGDK